MLRLLEVNRVLKYEKRLRCTYSLYGRHPATAIFNPSIVANFTTLGKWNSTVFYYQFNRSQWLIWSVFPKIYSTAGYNRQAPYRIISTQYDNNRVRDYNDDRKSGDMAAAKPAQLKTKRKRGRPKIRTDVTNGKWTFFGNIVMLKQILIGPVPFHLHLKNCLFNNSDQRIYNTQN